MDAFPVTNQLPAFLVTMNMRSNKAAFSDMGESPKFHNGDLVLIQSVSTRVVSANSSSLLQTNQRWDVGQSSHF